LIFYQQFFILFVCSSFIEFFWLSSTPSGGYSQHHLSRETLHKILQNSGSQASTKVGVCDMMRWMRRSSERHS
jgi:hypothetical protein